MHKMGEVMNSLRENKKKKKWNPHYNELFSTLSIDGADKSIVPYIELLKTSDFKKAAKMLKVSSRFTTCFGAHFEVSDKIKESFMKFVDYLLENERYKELYKQSMESYKILGDNKEIYEKVYNTTLSEFEVILSRIKNGIDNISPFYVTQVIKLLRGDAFIFRLGDGLIWFEKDYLYGDDAKIINDDHTDKPVYGYRMHVGVGASIYSLGSVFEDMGSFLKNVDTGAKAYVGMQSWLLDMDLLKYRLKRKGWTDENINEFISKYYGRLGEIKLQPIDPKSYERIKKRVKKFNKKDKELVESYENEGKKLQEGRCLINLTEYT